MAELVATHLGAYVQQLEQATSTTTSTLSARDHPAPSRSPGPPRTDARLLAAPHRAPALAAALVVGAVAVGRDPPDPPAPARPGPAPERWPRETPG